MYCRYCGTKLTLRFKENEGLVPYCENCGKFVFPFFPMASNAEMQAIFVVTPATPRTGLQKHIFISPPLYMNANSESLFSRIFSIE